MANHNSMPQDGLRRLLARLLGLVALILTASAGIVVFIAIPIDLAERVHALPHWSIFLVLVFAIAPIIVAWSHAGIYILLIVTASELALLILKPGIRRAKIEAALATGLCTVAYLFVYLANHFNFH
jgi:hypothetical protein